MLLTTRFRTRFWEAWVSASANVVATTADLGMGVVADLIFETRIVRATAELCSRSAGTAFLIVCRKNDAGAVVDPIARRHKIGKRYELLLTRSLRQ